MNRQEFIIMLRKGLSGLPLEDTNELITFYSEIIDDKIEEGLSEEDAVASVGDVSDIVAQAVADTPFAKIAKERIKEKRAPKAWEIVLIVLGSPLWLCLCVAVLAVIVSVYAALWAVIISLWAVFCSLLGCALGGLAACFVFIFNNAAPNGIAMLAVGFVCAGLGVFAFYGCKAATNGILILTKKLAIWTKRCFIKKEAE